MRRSLLLSGALAAAAAPVSAQIGLGMLLAGDPQAYHDFGYAVAYSGSTAVVGASGNDDAGLGSGSAYVFEYQNGWTQTQKLLASDDQAGDGFGFSVAIEGDRLFVGAPSEDEVGSNAGAVYVFERRPAGWIQSAKLLASDGAPGDQFGRSISVSGGRLLVGARYADDVAPDSGAAYLFLAPAAPGGAWTQGPKWTPTSNNSGHWFGDTVALLGQRALVGAPGDLNAYLFEEGALGWQPVTTLARRRVETTGVVVAQHPWAVSDQPQLDDPVRGCGRACVAGGSALKGHALRPHVVASSR